MSRTSFLPFTAIEARTNNGNTYRSVANFSPRYFVSSLLRDVRPVYRKIENNDRFVARRPTREVKYFRCVPYRSSQRKRFSRSWRNFTRETSRRTRFVPASTIRITVSSSIRRQFRYKVPVRIPASTFCTIHCVEFPRDTCALRVRRGHFGITVTVHHSHNRNASIVRG